MNDIEQAAFDRIKATLDAWMVKQVKYRVANPGDYETATVDDYVLWFAETGMEEA